MLKGWICGNIEDASLLKGLGVKLGKYNLGDALWEDCEVNEETMDKLDPYWGRFSWGLERE